MRLNCMIDNLRLVNTKTEKWDEIPRALMIVTRRKFKLNRRAINS